MEFKKTDLVVITGNIEKEKSAKLTAAVFEVCFVGYDELVVRPINGYSKKAFKIKKDQCTKINQKKSLNSLPKPYKIGSLVLVFDTDWSGNIKDHYIGHIQEIHDIPGKSPYCIILSNNKQHEAGFGEILTLEP